MTSVISTYAAGVACFGAAGGMFAQSWLEDGSTLERVVAGGALAGAAIWMVRWSLRLIAEVRTNSQLVADSLRDELEALRVERTELRETIGQLREAYAEERGRRIAAERTNTD